MKSVFLLCVSFFLQLVFSNSLSAATHTLTLNTNGNGAIGANPSAAAYPHNSTVTLTATPTSGWQFNGWSGNISGVLNPTNVIIDNDKVITANFLQIPSYALTVQVSGGGSVTPIGGSYLSNSVVQLTATASNGWTFHHWSGDASGSANQVSISMSSNKSVTAVFVEPVSITMQPANVIASPGSLASFSVTASGTGPLSYMWLFGGAPIAGANNATLTLSNVQLAIAGNYQAVVSGPYHSATSQIATLIVSCPGTNVVSVASDPALRAAIAIGGNVRLCVNGTIILTNTINVQKDVTIDGSGMAAAISGNSAVRLFNVSTGVVFAISNLALVDGLKAGTNGANAGATTVQNGESAVGGAIYNLGGSVSLVSCVLSNNRARGGDGGTGNNSLKANGAGGAAAGGAIFNAGGTISLWNVTALNNEARGGAGGTYFELGGTKYGNGGSAMGGFMHSIGGTIVATDCFAASNQAWAVGGDYANRPVASGGALSQFRGSFSLTNSIFQNNRALGANADGSSSFFFNDGANAQGGAITLFEGSGQMTRVTLHANVAQGGNSFRLSGIGEAFGGGVYSAGELQVVQSELGKNIAYAGAGGSSRGPASGWGGGIFNLGTMRLIGSTIFSNSVRGSAGYCVGSPFGSGGTPAFGGGVCNKSNSVFLLTNCTIALNQAIGGAPCNSAVSSGAAIGGGIYSEGELFIVHGTLVQNSVSNIPNSYQGGATVGANLANTNGVFHLRASLIATAGTNASVWGSVLDEGYNMSSDGSANFASGTSFNFTDPKVLPLAHNGGPTPTMALAPDSPAIDWVPIVGAPATDQRGFARPFGSGADVGAFEAGPPVPALAIRRSGNSVTISFPGQAGVKYRIEQSRDLLTWQTEENIAPLNSDGFVSRSYPSTQLWRSYRLTLDF